MHNITPVTRCSGFVTGQAIALKLSQKRSFMEQAKIIRNDAAKNPVQNLSGCWRFLEGLTTVDIRAASSIGQVGLEPVIRREMHQGPLSADGGPRARERRSSNLLPKLQGLIAGLGSAKRY